MSNFTNAPYMCGDEKSVYIPSSANNSIHTICMEKIDSTEFAAVYILTIDGEQVGDAIEIPKDLSVHSGEILYVTTADQPYEGAQVGDAYISLSVQNDGHVYIPIPNATTTQAGLMSAADKTKLNGLTPGGGGVSLDDVYPVGSVVITRTNTNPSANFGGTWDLIDKEFYPFNHYSTSNDSYVTFDSTRTKTTFNQKVYIQREGHTLEVYGSLELSASIADTEVPLFTLSEAALGGTLVVDVPIMMPSDGANGYCYAKLGTGGVLNSEDCISRIEANNVSNSIGVNETLRFHFTIVFAPRTGGVEHSMIDTYCNKFYWRRTA